MVKQMYLEFISVCALAIAILCYFGRNLDWTEVGLFYLPVCFLRFISSSAGFTIFS